MSSSSSKRRKLSPTRSVPGGEVPNTPSRLPVAVDNGQTTPKRPSFASPTKASISKHNPQLLERSKSSVNDGIPPSRGNAPAALSVSNPAAKTRRTPPLSTNDRNHDIEGAQSEAPTNHGEVGSEISPAVLDTVTDPFSPRKGLRRSPIVAVASLPDIQPISVSSGRDGLTNSPRQRSKSPETQPGFSVDAEDSRGVISQSQVGMPQAAEPIDATDPFKPKGLRRSPIGGQVPILERSASAQEQPEPNPFKRGGLRRSGVTDQVSLPSPPVKVQEQTKPVVPLPPKATTPKQEQKVSDLLRTRHAPPRKSAAPAPEQVEPDVPLPPQPSTPRQERIVPALPQTSHAPPAKFAAPAQVQAEPDVPLPPKASTPGQEQMVPAILPPNSAPPVQKQTEPQVVLPPKAPTPRQEQMVSAIIPPQAAPPVQKQVEPDLTLSLKAPIPRQEQILSAILPPKSAPPVQGQVRSAILPPSKTSVLRRGENETRPHQKPKPPTRRQEQAEPDLPPTPVQLGVKDPVVTTPPSGIHDTPSKRFKKRKSAGKPRSSPLKPMDLPVPQKMPEPAMPSGPEAVPFPKIAPINKEKAASYPRREIEPIDPHAQKKALREQLAKEVKLLETDLRLAQKENERLRQLQGLKGESSIPEKSDDLLDLLLRHAVPQQSVEPPAPSIFKSIISFLPFAGRKAIVEPISQQQEVPIITHNPLPLDNPLPFLQVFTPLTFSSIITLLPLSPPDHGGRSSKIPLQQHIITASSSTGLFTAQLSLIVDPSNFSINTLQLLDLDHNAEVELGRWARERISLAESGNVLAKDATTIFWAMARWFEIAVERAKFWLAVERNMGTIEGRREVMEVLKKRDSKKRKRRRGVTVAEEGGEEEAAEEAAATETHSKEKWTRKQLLSMMKRTEMVLLDGGEGVELCISWKISFDWTGEAENCMSASVRMPTTWRIEDERGSLAKIPQTFKDLVKAKGPMEATRVVVSLLMSA